MKAAWSQFKAKREAAEELMDSDKIIFDKELILEEPHTIKLTFSSSQEQFILERFETDLVQFLREELENSHIKIETQLVETPQSKKLYTNQEKFEYMVQQNEKLKKLQEKLGLDPNF